MERERATPKGEIEKLKKRGEKKKGGVGRKKGNRSSRKQGEKGQERKGRK